MLHTVRRKLERADSIDDEGRLSAEGGRGPCVVAKRTRKVKALTVALTGSRERNESAKDADKCDITQGPCPGRHWQPGVNKTEAVGH